MLFYWHIYYIYRLRVASYEVVNRKPFPNPCRQSACYLLVGEIFANVFRTQHVAVWNVWDISVSRSQCTTIEKLSLYLLLLLHQLRQLPLYYFFRYSLPLHNVRCCRHCQRCPSAATSTASSGTGKYSAELARIRNHFTVNFQPKCYEWSDSIVNVLFGKYELGKMKFFTCWKDFSYLPFSWIKLDKREYWGLAAGRDSDLSAAHLDRDSVWPLQQPRHRAQHIRTAGQY